MKRFLIFWIVLGVVIGVTPVFAGENREFNSILASVNGNAITLMDVLPVTAARENQLRAAYSGNALAQEIHKLRRKTVDNLIDSRLLQQEYEKQSFRIANSDIERELDRIAEGVGCRSREEFLLKLRKDGTTLEEVRAEVERNMMVQVMIQRRFAIEGRVTPREVYDYFQLHQKDFSGEEKIGLAMLNLEESRSDYAEAVAAVTAALQKDHAVFEAMVQKYTPEAGNACIGVIERSLLRREFSAALKDVAPGKVFGPLQIDGGTVWLKVTSYRAAAVVEFKDVEELITRELEKVHRGKLMEEYSTELRRKAVIEYYF